MSDIKPYEITVLHHIGEVPYEAIGHFLKGAYFVIECADGSRTMINNDDIVEIIIAKEWNDENNDETTS